MFKILPLYETNNDGLARYIASLVLEIEGFLYRIESEESTQEVLSILSTLESLYDISLFMDISHEDVKSEIFKCLSVINRLVEREEGMIREHDERHDRNRAEVDFG
ncbi:hypothetical protein EVJ32_05190 [Exiguobacterium sp. SH5S4]|uniref:hypothetical protein n=1 Tax=Exiguobacterium sp. SH5S4 TaxID=2510961 RepID=UPI001039C42E|nr:hypothetical protein [Exiguobacterium sp. SH5S4]TCI26773.1 hypothetical protein EVJ32_05190 [Exiguobacterium sp. SH5S4]